MDFSQRQADPRKHLAGITFVILFHALIVYALVTGLAKKVVEVVIAPIETKVIGGGAQAAAAARDRRPAAAQARGAAAAVHSAA